MTLETALKLGAGVELDRLVAIVLGDKSTEGFYPHSEDMRRIPALLRLREGYFKIKVRCPSPVSIWEAQLELKQVQSWGHGETPAVALCRAVLSAFSQPLNRVEP